MDLDAVVPVLRRLAAWDRQVAPGPWRALEMSALEVEGPARFDPDIDVDRDAFDRQEQVRARAAAWRGLVDRDGHRLGGEPLPGGSVQDVTDPTWRFIAELRSELPTLLQVCRTLWPTSTDPPQRTAGDGQGSDPTPNVSDETVERAAQAAYEALSEPVRWQQLPRPVREEWRTRARAALLAAST